MDKIARIRAEIRRRRLHFNKEAEKYQALNNGYSQNCYGARDALRDLENFLDTLSEEPDKSLEEAAETHVKNKYCLAKLLGAEIREAVLDFIAGAEWQKEQMLKDAVEGYVNYYEDSGGILMAEAQVGCPYHTGDKVRIIVMKEEEQI